jgi:hypothetical protein
MHTDVDLQLISETLADRKVIQLAIPGSNPMGVLRDLAHDPEFRGDVILSLVANQIVQGPGDEIQYLEQFRERGGNLNNTINWVVSAKLESVSVIKGGQVSPRAVLINLLSGRGFPGPSHSLMRFDRGRQLDFSKVDVPAYRAARIERAREIHSPWRESPLTDEDFAQGLAELKDLVSKIQERGGKVALVRFPTTDELWDLQEELFPRARFWDSLARECDCVTVHFQDLPGLDSVYLPDTSHLDYRGKPAFTRALLRILVDLGFFDAPQNPIL